MRKCLLFLSLIITFLGCSKTTPKLVQEADVDQFIQEKSIAVIDVQKSDINQYYYIFYNAQDRRGIYVLKSKEDGKIQYRNSSSSNKETAEYELDQIHTLKAYLGGNEDGSIGLAIYDLDILERAKYVSLHLKNQSILWFELSKLQQTYVFQDERILKNEVYNIEYWDENMNLINFNLK